MPARQATDTRRDREGVPAAGADGLTPAQRRTVARMAGRIAAGILAPARDAVAADGSPPAEAVERLFAASPEHVRDRR